MRPYRFHLARNDLVARNQGIVNLRNKGLDIPTIAFHAQISESRVRQILATPHFQTTPLYDVPEFFETFEDVKVWCDECASPIFKGQSFFTFPAAVHKAMDRHGNVNTYRTPALAFHDECA